MNLRIDDLQKIQNDLDTRIFELHKTSRSETMNDRILALLVELGEFANETRSFKYWSTKKKVNEKEMFEEFSDVLHFTLSLGIDIEFDEEVVSYESSELILTDLFRDMYTKVINFYTESSYINYEKMIVAMCQLADKVGLNAEKMREMYFFKNKINHERQDNNY